MNATNVTAATPVTTGADLLAYLQGLTAEQLALGVVLEGCDCEGNLSSANLAPGEIYLGRLP